jgi:release factor glutamine methyltransferase
MTLKNNLADTYRLFPNTPPRVIQALLLHVLGVDDISHLITSQTPLTPQQMENLQKCVDEHAQGRPLEYITKKCGFYAMEFIVSESVLIPRIETELLVEIAIKEIGNKKCKVLDLCTGSGAIAVAVAQHCPNAEILAVDISPQALEVCRQNIEKFNLQTQMDAVQMNVLEKIPSGFFDYILSNPPYIETETIPTLENSVKNFEPHLALDGGADGLIFYKKFYEYASSIKNTVFIIEIGYNQGNVVHEIFKIFNPRIIKDYNSHNRIIQFVVS